LSTPAINDSFGVQFKTVQMKKILIASIILILTTNVLAQQAGRVRIAFVGFKCLRETADDFLHLDGKADEVFLRFYFTVADRNGNMKLKYSNQTDTYGDNYGPFGNRVNAGSAVDVFGNLRGGIKGGDNFYCNNIIGEYDLASGDVLTVVPTIWEWDPGTSLQTSFDATIDGAYSVVNLKASEISNQRFNNNAPGSSLGINALGLILLDAGPLLSLKAIFNVADLLTPKPRPIGVKTNGEYSPKAVLFNANVMQQIAASNFGYGPGVIPVQYNEEALENSRDHGNYIILLKVDFTPKPTATTSAPPPPPPPPSSASSTTSSKNPTANMRKADRPSPSPAVPGTWTGTYGNGETTGPNFYSFILNADGTMKVMAANGNVMAQGTYTYSNNQLTGSYTYTNSSVFSFSAVMDANGSLNGTWGSGANVRGGGRWIMNKQ